MIDDANLSDTVCGPNFAVPNLAHVFFRAPTEMFLRRRALSHTAMPATDLHLAAKVGEMDEAEKFLAIEENKARLVAFATRVAACLAWCIGAWHSRFAPDSLQ
jgi:hypothetical protein